MNGTAPQAGPAPVPRPWLVAIPALAFLALAATLMLQRVWPFVDFFYIAAWYPTLFALDAVQATRTGKYYLMTRPRFAASLLFWSAVLWFFFELVNFRLANWYYVNLPPDRAVRWIGTAVSFATVLPAIFLAERVLDSRNVFGGTRWTGFTVTRTGLLLVFASGVGFAVLSLAWPHLFFPMVWGALTLLVEPWNYVRDPARSLLGDLSRGRPGRLLRLLVGGLGIGLLWELYNIESRSKWIYTVPGFENFKLFEMPLLGFFGFPVFALDCFVVYQALVTLRVAMPENREDTERRPRRGWTVAAVAIALAFSIAVLLGMDRWNTDSLRPRVDDLWLAGAAEVERLEDGPYADLFSLAGASPERLAEAANLSAREAEEWVAAARLATLRGIGVENARLLWREGIRSVAELAAVDPEELSARLRARAERPRAATPPKVRVWVDAARRQATGRYVPATDSGPAAEMDTR
ncbi:MAG: DUF4332 domain-containing protein [Gemmatimonadetes bacterium]|uniref:DUF4332 domain-containing protein n=1 Tax=Candidatus Kutchimonas denitrificans TaxID=3056748 RepID=A0AAE4Z6X7_9BACT|nr:DUF4332 domain-containing protein [Gemmatimonadota bacterium]NIR74723.1 DUF4332 domain-containing protein [Candidatus Kutchimonas denitrificans]NIS01473.1 DUF4332 domain-containing protein [Gemmatimonadota bacterium]NIT67214.1 DUF4332 domain-containing protein [Gemmatimonadota bacterium]NIU52388.1 DUF4332 domain-containing protein [Gemmatimonadota bacterium]